MDDVTKPQVLPMSRLYVPDEGEVDASVRPILEENKRQHGYLQNWIISLALNPGTLKRALAYFESLFNPNENQLTAVDREIIALVVSTENGCAYCATHHTKGLAQALKNPVRARRFAAGYDHVPDITPREHALAALAVKITRDPSTVTEADLDGLRKLGFEDRAILEVIETAAFFNYTNRVAISINNIPEDQLFVID